jgi:hypothetical protein
LFPKLTYTDKGKIGKKQEGNVAPGLDAESSNRLWPDKIIDALSISD